MKKDERFLKTYGPWAVVTGASDGIGCAVALELAHRGMNLVLIARRQPRLEELRKEIQSRYRVEVRTLALDLSQPRSTLAISQAIEDLDVGLFAAIAGFGTSGAFVGNPIEPELNMIDVNCRAVVEETHVFAQIFKNKGRGGIILVGSLVGFQGAPFAATYAATKAFIQSFGEALYFELKPFGVDVLCVAPGPVATGFSDRAKMAMARTDSAESVAQGMIAALGHQLTTRPGFLSKFLGWSLAPLPRYSRVQVIGKIMGQNHGPDGDGL